MTRMKIIKIVEAKRKGKHDHYVITLPKAIVEELQFKGGDYLMIESDIEHHRFIASLVTFSKKGDAK